MSYKKPGKIKQTLKQQYKTIKNKQATNKINANKETTKEIEITKHKNTDTQITRIHNNK